MSVYANLVNSPHVHEMDATVHGFCAKSLAKPVLSQMHMIGSESNAPFLNLDFPSKIQMKSPKFL
jgi:hypothetical protein